MEWAIIAAAFAAAGYMVYRARKSKNGGSFRSPGDNDQQR